MKKLSALILLCGLIWACTKTENDDQPDKAIDDFDRSTILVNWADNIIIPSYQAYVGSLKDLKTALKSFEENLTEENFKNLRTEWFSAYLSWQSVSKLEIGPAESSTLRNFTNVYPTDSNNIDSNISSGNYNFELPSTNDEQGFPALDYLLYGLANSDEEIILKLSNTQHINYLNALVDRMVDMANNVLNEWTGSYKDTFISKEGSTATSSLNKMANDFMFYYEKSLRAGKIGIPAGVFSTSPLANKVEGFYSGKGKELFLAALTSTQNFFNGTSFEGNNNGSSLADYLDYLNIVKEGADLSGLINTQFDLARTSAANLSNSLEEQVDSNNTLMLQTYDELQRAVVLMKVDMFQAMSIQVDYVDADGD